MKAYELICNYFVGEAQTQWDKITLEMHSKDPWFGVDGESHLGPRRRTWSSFMVCIELHKLTIFAVDAAETQRYYMQQSVKKPQRVPVRQFMARMGLLNDYLAHLTTVKNSPMVVKDTRAGNVPLDKADLASIILKSLPPMWLNQYNLNHTTLPKSPRQLHPDLEAIERVMNEKHNKKVKARAKDTAASANTKSNPKKRASTGSNEQRVPKKACTAKFCQHCKANSGPYTMHNTKECRKYDRTVRLVNPLRKSPTRSMGVKVTSSWLI